VEVTQDIAEELLQAADQYMLEGLKRLCEAAISAALTTDNLAAVHELSENFNAPQLARRCVLYSLEHYEEMVRTYSACPSACSPCGIALTSYERAIVSCPAVCVTKCVLNVAIASGNSVGVMCRRGMLGLMPDCYSGCGQAAAFEPVTLTALLHRMMPKFKETLIEQLLKKEAPSE
jgi:hypothetical protein